VLVWGKGLKRRPLPHTPIPLYTLYRAGTKYRAGHTRPQLAQARAQWNLR
jgi:hypothetical protein